MAQKNGIGLANVIAVVGIVALGVLTYLGRAFISGGEMGISIIWAVGVAAIATALLVLMIKAKGVESYFKQWKVVEVISLICYLAFAALTASTVVHFFVVTEDKEELKECAHADVGAITDLYNDYVATYNSNISSTVGFIRQCRDNASHKKEKGYDTFESFIESEDSIEEIETDYTAAYIVDVTSGYENDVKNNIGKWNAQIDGWSLLHISTLAKQVEEYYAQYRTQLIEIAGNNSDDYPLYLDTKLKSHKMQLGEKLKTASGETIIGWIVVVLVHFMILFNYFIASRSRIVSGKGGSNGGTRL